MTRPAGTGEPRRQSAGPRETPASARAAARGRPAPQTGHSEVTSPLAAPLSVGEKPRHRPSERGRCPLARDVGTLTCRYVKATSRHVPPAAVHGLLPAGPPHPVSNAGTVPGRPVRPLTRRAPPVCPHSPAGHPPCVPSHPPGTPCVHGHPVRPRPPGTPRASLPPAGRMLSGALACASLPGRRPPGPHSSSPHRRRRGRGQLRQPPGATRHSVSRCKATPVPHASARVHVPRPPARGFLRGFLLRARAPRGQGRSHAPLPPASALQSLPGRDGEPAWDYLALPLSQGG